MCYLQQTHFRPKDTDRLKVRAWKNIFLANGNQEKGGVAILILDKINLKIKIVTRDKEVHYITIKKSIQEEMTTQHSSTSVHKTNANSHKRGNQQ